MEKVAKWWKQFMSRDYLGFYYAQADRFYYDLLVMELEPDKFFTIPAPMLADYLELEHSRGELLEFAPIYFRIWSGEERDNARIIDREEYEQWLQEARMRQENRIAYERLSGEEKEIMDRVREGYFVLETVENQFGEKIVTEWISGYPDHSYYLYQLACWSSWWKGFGTCQCVSHDTFTKRPISVEDVLDVVKQLA